MVAECVLMSEQLWQDERSKGEDRSYRVRGKQVNKKSPCHRPSHARPHAQQGFHASELDGFDFYRVSGSPALWGRRLESP